MATDAAYGLRSIQVSSGAAAACGFCGYFAAKALTNAILLEDGEKRATTFTIIGFGVVAVSAVYAMFMIYKGSPRTKMLAALALAISLGGGYGGWTLGWKKGGNPTAINTGL